MKTDADAALEKASEHLLQAWRELQMVLDPDTFGHDDFKPEYMEKVQEVSDATYSLHRKMRRER